MIRCKGRADRGGVLAGCAGLVFILVVLGGLTAFFSPLLEFRMSSDRAAEVAEEMMPGSTASEDVVGGSGWDLPWGQSVTLKDKGAIIYLEPLGQASPYYRPEEQGSTAITKVSKGYFDRVWLQLKDSKVVGMRMIGPGRADPEKTALTYGVTLPGPEGPVVIVYRTALGAFDRTAMEAFWAGLEPPLKDTFRNQEAKLDGRTVGGRDLHPKHDLVLSGSAKLAPDGRTNILSGTQLRCGDLQISRGMSEEQLNELWGPPQLVLESWTHGSPRDFYRKRLTSAQHIYRTKSGEVLAHFTDNEIRWINLLHPLTPDQDQAALEHHQDQRRVPGVVPLAGEIQLDGKSLDSEALSGEVLTRDGREILRLGSSRYYVHHTFGELERSWRTAKVWNYPLGQGGTLELRMKSTDVVGIRLLPGG